MTRSHPLNPGRLLVTILFAVSLMTPVTGAFNTFGTRAASMGGAFTAVASDLSAFYWNPAGLSLIQNWAVEMQYGQNTEAAEDSQDLLTYIHENDPGSIFSHMSLDELEEYVDRLHELDGYPWLVRGGDHAAVAIGYKGYALSISSYDLFYIEPEVDLDNLGYLDPSEWSLGNNTTQLDFSGLHIQEYAVSSGWIASNGSMAMGITAKYIDLKGYSWQKRLWDIDSIDPDDLLDRVEDGSEFSDDGWSFDLGVLFLARGSRIGLAAKNLNSYDLKFNEDMKLKIKPQYRIGYAYLPTDRFMFALDYTLGKKRDLYGKSIDGRELSMGFEGVLGQSRWLLIRGGASREFSGDAPVMFSIGSGIHVERLYLEFGYSTDQDGDSHRLWGGMRVFF